MFILVVPCCQSEESLDNGPEVERDPAEDDADEVLAAVARAQRLLLLLLLLQAAVVGHRGRISFGEFGH